MDPVDIPAAWEARVGKWVAKPERDQDAIRIRALELRIEDEFLRLDTQLEDPTGAERASVVLVPLDRDRARIAGVGRATGDVIYIADDVLHAWGLTFRPE